MRLKKLRKPFPCTSSFSSQIVSSVFVKDESNINDDNLKCAEEEEEDGNDDELSNLDDNISERNSVNKEARYSFHTSRSNSLASLTFPSHQEVQQLKRKSESTKSTIGKHLVKKGKTAKSEYLDEMELNLIGDLSRSMKNDNDSKDPGETDIYVRSLAG